MNHAIHPPARTRLQRSQLAVPGSQSRMIEKASVSAADCVFLDLEDAVAPDDKARARANVIQALRDIDWRAAGKSIAVRINGLDTPWMYRDLIEVVEQAGDRLDTILVPKVGAPADLYLVDALCGQIEQAMGFEQRIGLEALIETALGMVNIEAIAAFAAQPPQSQSPSRLEALHFGPGDYAASCRARTVNIGGLHPDYPGDPWHFALSRMTVACRAYGLRAIDGAFDDIQDAEGYRAAARRAAALGMEGKWAIHPSQIALANEVFTPPPEEVARAKAILAALNEARAKGQGAAQFDGKMIDAASARMAQRIAGA